MADLAPENADAWQLFFRVTSRFAADLHCVNAVLARVLDSLDGDEALDLLERLSLIYDTLCPPPEPKS